MWCRESLSREQKTEAERGRDKQGEDRRQGQNTPSYRTTGKTREHTIVQEEERRAEGSRYDER